MEKLDNYDAAQALTGEYEALKPGGYICKIVSAKEAVSSTNKKMLVLAIDIAEGEHKGFFTRRYDELRKSNNDPSKEVKYPSGGIYRQMLEGEKAAGYLKGLMTSLEASNPGFKWDWDEKKLVGLKCGAIFGEEEYLKLDNSVGISCKVKFIRTTKCIEDGNFRIPELKKLPTKGDCFEGFDINVIDSDDLPF